MTKWLIDFDSTLSNTFDASLVALNEKYGTNYSRDMFSVWLTEDMMPPEHAIYLWGEEVFLNHDFQMSVPPVEGAIETTRKLIEHGDTVMVVSDRPKELGWVTIQWLARHKLADVEVVLTHNKHSRAVPTAGGRTKAQVAWQNRLTHVVEDAPHHAESFANRHFIKQVYLLDYPHNRNVEHDKIQRVASWKEIA